MELRLQQNCGGNANEDVTRKKEECNGGCNGTVTDRGNMAGGLLTARNRRTEGAPRRCRVRAIGFEGN